MRSQRSRLNQNKAMILATCRLIFSMNPAKCSTSKTSRLSMRLILLMLIRLKPKKTMASVQEIRFASLVQLNRDSHQLKRFESPSQPGLRFPQKRSQMV